MAMWGQTEIVPFYKLDKSVFSIDRTLLQCVGYVVKYIKLLPVENIL